MSTQTAPPSPQTLAPVLAYIDAYWEKLTRAIPHDESTRIGLPRPYVVPGVGAMFQEMYYWDSFFTALGLVNTRHAARVEDMTENMAWLIQRFGLIPNATRYYMLSRSQPPFFTQMVRLCLQARQAQGEPFQTTAAWLQRMLAAAEAEHNTVWFGTAQPHHRLVHGGMSRYFDINYLDMLASCESGWDHSTRCGDRWLSHLPVDLNAILYVRERDMADFATLLGDAPRAAAWSQRAAERAAAFSALFWDDAQGFFFDYDYTQGARNPTPSLAGFYPLWAGLATAEQAARVVAAWLPRFLQPGGVVTALDAQPGRQWAWPNGWAPLQWIVAQGLDAYGYAAQAQQVRAAWCSLCAAWHARTGVLWEKYNVVDVNAEAEPGLYGHVTGFGWTNGVFVDFARHLAPGIA